MARSAWLRELFLCRPGLRDMDASRNILAPARL
jgi:hypothetical protein